MTASGQKQAKGEKMTAEELDRQLSLLAETWLNKMKDIHKELGEKLEVICSQAADTVPTHLIESNLVKFNKTIEKVALLGLD